jgi:O-antigen ligase
VTGAFVLEGTVLTWRRFLLLTALTVPWVSPFAVGPSPAVVPWLVSVVCATVLFAQWRYLQWEDIARAWLIAAMLSAFAGFVQYFGVSARFGPWINYAEAGTAFANLRQRNQFATLTSIGMAALWYLERRRRNCVEQSVDLRGQLLPVLCAILLGAANAISASRTGLVQWLLLGATLYLLSRGEPSVRRLPIAAWIGYAGAAWLLPILADIDPLSGGIFSRFGEEAACASRLVLWSNVVDLILLRPWFGWGWGELDYAHYITLYRGARFCDILDNAHNLPLHLAVELGIPLAVAIVSGVGWLVVRQRPWRERQPVRLMAWLVLAAIGLHSMLEYPLWYGPFQLAALLSIMILSVQQPHRIRRHHFICVVVCALVVASLYIAWDYHRISQIYRPPERRTTAYRTDTLAKIEGSFLFRRQVQFAWLTTTPLNRNNAEIVHKVALELLHFSPEPRVVERLIDSAQMLGREEEVQYHLARYLAAFRREYTPRDANQ